MRKFFYPLFPCKGKRYREKHNIIFIYIDADFSTSEFVSGAVYDGKNLDHFETPQEVANYLTFVPSGSWVITYNLGSWHCLYNAFINTFDYITGIGKDNTVLTLKYDDKNITIIDVFSFFVMPLHEAIFKMSGIKLHNETAGVYTVFVSFLWGKIVKVLKDKFNVYPSKTPGATSIKIFRRFMKFPILASGLQAIRLTTSAIRPPALHWKPGVYENAYLYDLNAAYPHVMRVLRYPKRLRLFAKHPPTIDRWIATVRINYHCNSQFSPLSIPLIKDTRVNPTDVKNLTITLTYIDYQILQLTGEVEILEYIEGVYWTEKDETDLFSEWANIIETASLENPQNKIILKIVSRSLHSKFSQKHFYYQTEIIRADQDQLKRLVKSGKVADIYPLDNGDIAIKKITRKTSGFKPFDRPDWEALTLAMCRFIMYASINQDTVYSHTDCIISTVPRDDLQIGLNFGAWKLKDMGAAFIAGLGLYSIGDSAGATGLNTSKKQAREAIRSAAAGIEKLVTTLNFPGFMSSVEHGETDFTVRTQPYPKARVNGSLAWVTRSPTRVIPIVRTNRLLTGCDRERNIKTRKEVLKNVNSD